MPTGEALADLLEPGDQEAPALVRPAERAGGAAATVPYGRLRDHVADLAGRLAAAGVRRGDRVAVALPNGADLVELLLAVNALGAAAAPLNPAYTRDEFAFYLGDIAPRLLLVPGGSLPAAREAAREAAGGPGAAQGFEVVDVVDAPSPGAPAGLLLAGDELRASQPFEAGGPDDVALVLHTSGTTSRPKQVPLRQRHVAASARTIAGHYGLGPGDVSFCAMPLFHIHGLLASVLAALAGGGSVVVPRRFTPQSFWRQAREHQITWLSAGPTLHQMILDRLDGEGTPTSLRFTRSCSSALTSGLMERAEGIYGVPMLQAYGMTEASHQIASNPLPPQPRAAESVGVATGTEIAIIDRDRRFVADGTDGEVVIRGPAVTDGYFNNADANADAFFDGWFRTGDIGVLSGGYLRLVGRLKEMILRGGENISPAEIEQVLLAHPAVADAACFGLPDDKYGERVTAAVVLVGEADERALITWCRERLAAFKVPDRVFVVEAIPRTATGKPQRRKAAELVAGRL